MGASKVISLPVCGFTMVSFRACNAWRSKYWLFRRQVKTTFALQVVPDESGCDLHKDGHR